MDPSVKIPQPPKGHLLLQHIGALYTGNDTLGDIFDASILIKDNVIEWVGPSSEVSAEALTMATNERGIRDCSHIAMATAGFINTHHHFYQTITRGVAPDCELFGWLETLYDIWKHMTPSMYSAACKATACELILSGCTLATDHAYIYYNGMRLDDEIAAVLSTGLRFQPVRGAMSLGRSEGGLPPDECVERDEDEILRDMTRLVETYHDAGRYAMLRIALGPCSPFSVTNDLMIGAARLARKYEGVLLHTHLAENANDIEYCLETYGCRPKDYIASVEWNDKDCWFAHCVQLDDEDIDYFAEKQCGVAHCPSSNMRLASGIAPVRTLLDKKVPTGLGVDGAASNDGSHLLGEARLSTLLSRVKPEAGGDPGKALSAREALFLATAGGAACLNREDEVGQVAPGFAADIVGWTNVGESATALSMVGCCYGGDPLSGLILTGPPTVTMSVINGDVVVWDGTFVNLNLAEVIKEANEASKELFRVAGYKKKR